MKKKWWIILVIILIILILGYFFNPACNFHRIGSNFKDSDGCNSCQCSIGGKVCTQMGCNVESINDEIQKELDNLFNNS